MSDFDGGSNFAEFPPSSRLARGYLEGLGLAWSSVSVAEIALGRCRDDDDGHDIVSAGALSPDITASGANGLDTGDDNEPWAAISAKVPSGHFSGNRPRVRRPSAVVSRVVIPDTKFASLNRRRQTPVLGIAPECFIPASKQNAIASTMVSRTSAEKLAMNL